MHTTDLDTLPAWLDRYVEAWRTYDRMQPRRETDAAALAS